MRRVCRSSGFTLIELIVVVTVVMLIVGGVLLSLTRTGTQIWSRSDSQIASATAAQQALNRVTEDLRRARRFGLNCSTAFGGGYLWFNPVDGGPTVQYAFNPFTDTKDTLVRTQNGVPQVMVGGLTQFIPKCGLGDDLVRISVTAEVKGFAGSWGQTLMSQVRVQNP